MSDPAGRAVRLAAYFDLTRERPHWFKTPADGFQIVLDRGKIAEIEDAIGRRYAASGRPAEWAEVGVQYRDPYLLVLRDAVIFPDGSPGIHHRTLRYEGEPSGVAVLPLLGPDIVLIRHYRHPTRAWSWEIPRGAIEPGVSIEDTVRAELREELEAETVDCEEMGLLYGASGFMGLGVRLFVARISGFGAPALGEGISSARTFGIAEVEELIRSSAMTDSFSLAAFLHARLRGLI